MDTAKILSTILKLEAYKYAGRLKNIGKTKAIALIASIVLLVEGLAYENGFDGQMVGEQVRHVLELLLGLLIVFGILKDDDNDHHKGAQEA